jgi:hypothetical protein
MGMPCVHILLVCAKWSVPFAQFIAARYRIATVVDIITRVRAHDDNVAGPVADAPRFVPRAAAVAVVPSPRQSAADERVLQSIEDDMETTRAWLLEQRRRRAQGEVGVVRGNALACVSQQSRRSTAVQRRASAPTSLLAGEDVVRPGRCIVSRQGSVRRMLSARERRRGLSDDDDGADVSG